MATTFDGYELLRLVGSHPESFPALRTDLAKQAETLLKKQLKDKSLGLGGLRNLASLIGRDNFGLLIEVSKSSELGSLQRKFDKFAPETSSGDVGASRRHLIDLAFGDREPAPKPLKAKSSRSASRKVPKASSPFGTSAMGARRG